MIMRLLFTDRNGSQMAPAYYCAGIPEAQALAAAIEPITLAATYQARYTFVGPISSHVPRTGEYPTVHTALELTYGTTAGRGLARILVPAPGDGCWAADGETYRPGWFAGLEAAILAYAVLPSGDPVDTFLSGHRRTMLAPR